MSNLLHMLRVNQIIETFNECAFEYKSDLSSQPFLYEFRGTSDTYIRFKPHSDNNSDWKMLVWTQNKYAFIQDSRDLIHGLLSNGYENFFTNYYGRDMKKTRILFKLQYNCSSYKMESKITPITKTTELHPLCHILAIYDKKGDRIRFAPMYKTAEHVPDVSSSSEVKTL